MMPVVAEDLLKHAAFVRSLARSLLLDPQAADDVVQQTWLTALESPPRHAGNLRGWLARVVSRQVLRRARAESRRRCREAAILRDRAAPPADDSLARAEAQRRLAEAVTGLEEPYREVVLLRYFDGLPPRAIARRLGVPVETVRTRLKRALAVLRARLDEGHGGDRRAWALSLAPLALVEATAADLLGIALRGGLAMSKWKVLAAAAALALLCVGTLFSIRALGETETTQRGEAVSLSAADVAPAPSERSGAVVGRTYVHKGVVRDAEGVPVEGVRVVCFDALAPADRLEVLTDAEGRFSVALPHPSDTSLRFMHPDYWSSEAHVWFQHERPAYDVRKGTPVRVTVLDPEGKPVAGAEVTLSFLAQATVLADRRAVTHEQTLGWAETGPDGVARLAAPECEVSIEAKHDERGLGWGYVHVMGPAATTVRLEPLGAIEGRVLDGKEEPVDGARVFAGGREARTGAEGRYRIERVGAGEVEVRAEAGARGVGGFGLDLGWGHDLPVLVPTGGTVRDIDITLRPGAWIRGRLVDETGRPLEGIGVKLWSNLWFPERASAADGTFGLGPCGVWQRTAVSVHFDTDAYASYGVREVALPSFDHMALDPGGEIDLGTVVGQRRGTVRGRVVEVDGTPARAGGVMTRAGRSTPILPDGSFELVHVGPGAVTLHALLVGERPRRSEDREVAVAPGQVIEGIELVLADPLVELKGRVMGKDGLPRDGISVGCVPHDARPEQPLYHSDWTRGGEFALSGLRPGRYLVGIVFDREPLKLEAAREVDVTEAGGYVELVVEDAAAAAKIVGKVVDDRDGSPVESFSAKLFRFEWFVPRFQSSTWGNGKFELLADEAGRHTVEIDADGFAGYRTPAFDLEEGATKDLGTIRLGPAGAIEVVVRDHAGSPVRYAKAYALSGKLEHSLSEFTDTDGRVHLFGLNPGTYALFVASPRHPIGILRDLAVGAGDVLRTDVELPAAAPVTIVVRDAAGRAVPGAKLVYTFPALAPLDSSIAERYEPPGFGSNVADAEGRIRKPCLPTGEVTLTVTAAGFKPASRTIDRGPGETTEIEIILGR